MCQTLEAHDDADVYRHSERDEKTQRLSTHSAAATPILCDSLFAMTDSDRRARGRFDRLDCAPLTSIWDLFLPEPATPTTPFSRIASILNPVNYLCFQEGDLIRDSASFQTRARDWYESHRYQPTVHTSVH
jgi:hypothetical protein